MFRLDTLRRGYMCHGVRWTTIRSVGDRDPIFAAFLPKQSTCIMCSSTIDSTTFAISLTHATSKLEKVECLGVWWRKPDWPGGASKGVVTTKIPNLKLLPKDATEGSRRRKQSQWQIYDPSNMHVCFYNELLLRKSRHQKFISISSIHLIIVPYSPHPTSALTAYLICSHGSSCDCNSSMPINDFHVPVMENPRRYM